MAHGKLFGDDGGGGFRVGLEADESAGEIETLGAAGGGGAEGEGGGGRGRGVGVGGGRDGDYVFVHLEDFLGRWGGLRLEGWEGGED